MARFTVSGWLLSSDHTGWDSASLPSLRLRAVSGALAVDWGVGSASAMVILLLVTPILIWNVYSARKEMR